MINQLSAIWSHYEHLIDVDVLLIQPSSLFRKKVIDPDVEEYFNCLSDMGGLTGDSPIEPNYGLLSLATNLVHNNISVEILDLNYIDFHLRAHGEVLDDEIISSLMNSIRAKIIGISYMTTSFGNWENHLYQLIRGSKHFNQIPIIYGGIHPSIQWEKIKASRNDDNLFIMLGEGEDEFPQFCSQHLGKTPDTKDLNGIAGCSENPKKQLVPSLSLCEKPLPDYSLLPQYIENNVRRYYLTRGCAGRCSFCSVSSFHAHKSGQYYRQLFHSDNKFYFNLAKKIIEDYKNGHDIVMGDLTFFENDWYYKEFCQHLIREIEITGIKPKWWCQTRADCISESTVELMKAAGCCEIAIGCETANDKILSKMVKNITSNEWKQALRVIKKFDITTQAYFIIGAGYDNSFTVMQNIDNIREMIDEGLVDLVHVSVLVPFPGTALSKHPGKHGINIVDNNYENYWMNCDKYGYGMPVYETVSEDGTVLLKRDEIYKYWKQALIEITNCYKRQLVHNNAASYGG